MYMAKIGDWKMPICGAHLFCGAYDSWCGARVMWCFEDLGNRPVDKYDSLKKIGQLLNWQISIPAKSCEDLGHCPAQKYGTLKKTGSKK